MNVKPLHMIISAKREWLEPVCVYVTSLSFSAFQLTMTLVSYLMKWTSFSIVMISTGVIKSVTKKPRRTRKTAWSMQNAMVYMLKVMPLLIMSLVRRLCLPLVSLAQRRLRI